MGLSAAPRVHRKSPRMSAQASRHRRLASCRRCTGVALRNAAARDTGSIFCTPHIFQIFHFLAMCIGVKRRTERQASQPRPRRLLACCLPCRFRQSFVVFAGFDPPHHCLNQPERALGKRGRMKVTSRLVVQSLGIQDPQNNSDGHLTVASASLGSSLNSSFASLAHASAV